MKKENRELAIQLRHELHQHPELSLQEIWTRKHIMEFLKNHTNLEVVNKGNWFYAVYRNPEATENIAFRADFDAVPIKETIPLSYASQNPGVSHKCGHDGHAAVLAGLAMEIDQNGSDKNVFFLWQPAEETGEGAIQCTSLIRDNHIDEIYAFHNMSGWVRNGVYVKDGTAHCASRGMTIQFEGKPTHASQPEFGINPAHAIAMLILAIPDFIDSSYNKGMVLGTIVHVDVGSKNFGIAASKGALRLTIRALYEEELNNLQSNLENLAQKLAGEEGLAVSFEFQDSFPETVNHKESSDKVRAAARFNGLQVIEMEEAFRGSEDFGHLLKLTKGAIFYIGNGVDYPPLHTYEYDYPDETLETAVEMFKSITKL